MFFDERADAAVRQLWRRLADSGLPNLGTHGHRRHRPHVSLTVAADSDRDITPEVLADVGAAADARRRPHLNFQALGVFTGRGGVLFLAVAATSPLLALHERVSEILRNHRVDQHPHYLPGTWVPHCTLAIELLAADLSTAVGLLSGFQPFQGRVGEIGMTDTTTAAVTVLG